VYALPPPHILYSNMGQCVPNTSFMEKREGSGGWIKPDSFSFISLSSFFVHPASLLAVHVVLSTTHCIKTRGGFSFASFMGVRRRGRGEPNRRLSSV